MTDVVARNLRPAIARWWPAAVCALAGFAVFQFFGNATRGYIHTRSMFWWWSSQWFDPAAESEHGIMILGISLWLLWRNLKNTAGYPSSANESDRQSRLDLWHPVLAMLGGLGLHLLGYAVQQTRISIFAALLFVWGVLGLAGGQRWRRAAAFPLAFLVFAIPVNVLDTLEFYLRMEVITLADAAARAVGIEVVRNGTQLFSPHGGFQYDVAAACSGVRSMMALAALSLLVGHLNFRTGWRRLLLLALCVPYTFLGNVARIFAIIAAAEWLGQKAGVTVHAWFGFLVFLIVLGLQFATVTALKKWLPEAACRRSHGTLGVAPAGSGVDPSDLGPHIPGVRFPPATIVGSPWNVTAAVLLTAVLVVLATRRIDALTLSPEVGVLMSADGLNPVSLPTFLGTEWMGQDVPISEAERAILPADTGFSRKNYVSLQDRTRQVFVSIVLSGRDRTSIHRPELCLVGQGWTVRSHFVHRFDYPGAAGGSIPATVLRVQRQVMVTHGERVVLPSLVAYWFVGRDRVVATHWERMWWGAWDRLFRRQGDRWAYVVMQTSAFDGDAAALGRLQAVLDQTLPAFQKRLVRAGRISGRTDS